MKTSTKTLGLTLVVGALALGGVSAQRAQAFVNPLIETCHTKGGEFVVLNPGVTEDLPMCVFGEASIGAVALKSDASGESVEAVEAFRRTKAPADPESICTQTGGVEVTGTTRDTGGTYQVCRYADGSLIDLGTLARGSDDASNAALAAAL